MEAIPDKDWIFFSWDQPSCGERNGIILNYTYTLTPANQEGTTEGNNITLQGLNPCTDYTLSISAVTSVGAGVNGQLKQTTENDGKHSNTNVNFWATYSPQFKKDFKVMAVNMSFDFKN